MTPNNPRPGPQAGELIRRLRAWPVSSWAHGDRIDATRATARRLADLATAGGPTRPVPELAPHGLADQLAVLYRDAADHDSQAADQEMARLAIRLGFAAATRG